MTIEKNYVHYVHDSIIKKSCSGLGLNIMQGNFTLGTLWISTDLTFYYWNMMNQYWFTMALGSGSLKAPFNTELGPMQCFFYRKANNFQKQKEIVHKS